MHFAADALDRKLKEVHLINIQGAIDIKYEFAAHGVTRLVAPSETGKSVLTRALTFFVLGQASQKDMRDSILRDNTTTSAISLKLYDGNELSYIYKNGISMYHRKYPDGRNKVFPGETPPKEILDALGYYVDLEEDICLNIRESEPLALIHTPDRTNSSIFNCVLENPTIDKSLNSLEVRLNNLVMGKARADLHLREYATTLQNLPKIEETEEELNLKLNEIKYNKTLYKQVSVFNSLLKDTLNKILYINKFAIKPLDVNTIRNNIEILDTNISENISTIISTITSLQKLVLDMNSVDIDSLRTNIDKHHAQELYNNTLVNLSSKLVSIMDNANLDVDTENLINILIKFKAANENRNALNEIITLTIELDNYSKFNEKVVALQLYSVHYNSIYSFTDKLGKVTNMLSSVTFNQHIDNTTHLEYLNKYNVLKDNTLDKILSSLHNVTEHYTGMCMLDTKLDRIKKECGYCPLCGTAFTEHNKEMRCM